MGLLQISPRLPRCLKFRFSMGGLSNCYNCLWYCRSANTCTPIGDNTRGYYNNDGYRCMGYERDTKEVTGMTNKNECHSCKWFCQYEPVCMHESLDHELYSESDYCCSDYEEDDRE